VDITVAVLHCVGGITSMIGKVIELITVNKKIKMKEKIKLERELKLCQQSTKTKKPKQ